MTRRALEQLRRRYEDARGELTPLGERLAEDLHSDGWALEDDREVEPYPESSLY